VLSVLQPWAWAIIHGGKPVENRSWATSYRGPLLIQAGASRRCLGDAPDLLAAAPSAADLPFGCLVGAVELVGCVRRKDYDPTDRWAFGPWCWLLRNPRPLVSPVPLRGSLGLFPPPAGLSLRFAGG
jgi:hypothetical protein